MNQYEKNIDETYKRIIADFSNAYSNSKIEEDTSILIKNSFARLEEKSYDLSEIKVDFIEECSYLLDDDFRNKYYKEVFYLQFEGLNKDLDFQKKIEKLNDRETYKIAYLIYRTADYRIVMDFIEKIIKYDEKIEKEYLSDHEEPVWDNDTSYWDEVYHGDLQPIESFDIIDYDQQSRPLNIRTQLNRYALMLRETTDIPISFKYQRSFLKLFINNLAAAKNILKELDYIESLYSKLLPIAGKNKMELILEDKNCLIFSLEEKYRLLVHINVEYRNLGCPSDQITFMKDSVKDNITEDEINFIADVIIELGYGMQRDEYYNLLKDNILNHDAYPSFESLISPRQYLVVLTNHYSLQHIFPQLGEEYFFD